MEAPPSRPTYRFGEFEFDPASGELHKAGSKVRLQEQPCQILSLLLRRPGEVVTREEVRHALWPGDTFVDFDMGLNSAIKRLRDALEDSADHPRYVETLPRRGYRFVAALAPPAVAPAAPSDVVTPPRPSVFRSGRALAAAAVMTAVVVGLALRAPWLRGRGQDTPPAAIRSLAVLPFENLTGSADQDYFVDGMTDALITDLAQARALRVISRTSVMRYKGTTKSLPRVAEELGVDAVVEGTVARDGDRVRITAQLIQAATDRHLWARSYEREVRDVLGLQREVAAAVAQAIQVKLQPETRPRLARAREVEPEAYEAYLKGRYYWSKRSPADTLKAVDAFQAAIARDPDYAPAHAGLSDAYRSFDVQGLGAPRDVMPRAEAAARKALALDESLAEAHASLAGVLYRYHWDWEGAEKEFRISLDLDPGSAETHRAYAVYLMTLRRHEEALAEAQRARELSPLSSVINAELGTALVRLGRCDEAVAGLHKTLEIDPQSVRLYQTLGEAYDAKGQWAQGVAALEKSDTLSPAPYPWLGYAYGMAGRRREAREILARLDKASRERFVSPQSFAVVHLGLGDRGQALAWLEKAYDQHAFEVLGFSGEIFDQLRDDPRFQDLLRRMRLPIAGDPAPRRHASLLMRPHG